MLIYIPESQGKAGLCAASPEGWRDPTHGKSHEKGPEMTPPQTLSDTQKFLSVSQFKQHEMC
jgi:hypothetical protein